MAGGLGETSAAAPVGDATVKLLLLGEPFGSQKVVLPYPPSANRYWRIFRGRAVTSQEALQYKRAVGLLCQQARTKPLKTPVTLSVEVFRPAKRGDLDNCLKVLLDALQGHMYLDDAQVKNMIVHRHEDPKAPRVVVVVSEASP